MTRTLTVEGPVADDEVEAQLTTQGSTTAPSRQVPADADKIEAIIASFTSDQAADGGAVLFIRLRGAGVLGGEQVICVGGMGSIAGQSGSDEAPHRSTFFALYDVAIPVRGGSVIDVVADLGGDDLGTVDVSVTLIFG